MAVPAAVLSVYGGRMGERGRRFRVAAAGVWLVALVVTTVVWGPPVSLEPLFLWLLAAMLVASIGNPVAWVRGMLVDWLPLYVLLLAYRVAWGLSDRGVAHLNPQHAFDVALFGDPGATAALQGWLWRGDAGPLDWFAWFVYLSHFWVPLTVAAVLWAKHRRGFLAYRRRLVAVWACALVVYALYPTVPPWMAAMDGDLPAMVRPLMEVWNDGPPRLNPPPAVTTDLHNLVAAVPSMHAALPAVLALFLWPRAGRWRPLLAAYPLLMGAVLVYSGDHYLFDLLAGWALAYAVHRLVGLVDARDEQVVTGRPGERNGSRRSAARAAHGVNDASAGTDRRGQPEQLGR